MPTIRERIRRGFQQQAERLRAALAALLSTMAAHNFVRRGVADVAVYRLGSPPLFLFAYLCANVGLASLLAPNRRGSQVLCQNDFLSAHELTFGTIIFRTKEMFA